MLRSFSSKLSLFLCAALLIIQLPSLAQQADILVLSGETAPGDGQAFTSFTQAWQDEAGAVVFQGVLEDGTRGLWLFDDTGLTKLLRDDEPLPGIGEEVLVNGVFYVIGIEAGSFAAFAPTAGGGALVVGSKAGVSTVAYGGMPAPGTSNFIFRNIDNITSNGEWSHAFNDGVLAFTALATDSLQSEAQNGIWVSTGGGAPSLITLSDADQFDEVDEWPEVPGHVFEFRDVHVSDAGQVFFRARASNPVAQYVFKSDGSGRSLVDIGGDWNPLLIRVGSDSKLAVVGTDDTDQVVLLETSAGSGSFETVMMSGETATDAAGNATLPEPWLHFGGNGMGFDASGQLYVDADLGTSGAQHGVWVRRLDGSVELELKGGFIAGSPFNDPTPIGLNKMGDLAIVEDRTFWFQPAGEEPSRIVGEGDQLTVAPGDQRQVDVIFGGLSYFVSPSYGGRTSVLNDEPAALLSVRFTDDSFAIARFTNLAGGLTINSTADGSDTNAGDGVCNTGGVVDGEPECTLRAALEEANAVTDPDNINFDISSQAPYAITVQSPLPAIINPVNLTGPNYTDLPDVLIDGVAAGDGASGLVLEAGAAGSTIKNLWLLAFSGPGISIDADEVTVSQCVAGLDGSQLTGNGTGIQIVGDRNNISGSLVSGNKGNGIDLSGNENSIVDNIIGLDNAASEELGNEAEGIRIIGDQNLVDSNVISRNTENGIALISGNGNEIYKNLIGTNGTGLSRIGNVENGILVDAAVNTVIGNAGEGNVISGNLNNGILIQQNASGTLVLGNFIGTDPQGEPGVFNINAGVYIDGASGNLIGSVSPETGNYIRDNEYGVVVTGSGVGNTIRYNIIDKSRTLDIDLAGDEKPTPNDLDAIDAQTDADVGANSLMNFPVGILRSVNLAGDILVSGQLDTPDPVNATIDLYGVEEAHEAGVGGGREWLGSLEPDSTGHFLFILSPSVTYTLFSATATDAAGSTSEFSPVCADPDNDGNPDSDGDGLCDTWETDGIDYDMDGIIDLKFAGNFAADPQKKDIYVEVDWMQSAGAAGHSHEPLQASLDQVKAAFARSPVQNPNGETGIRVHFVKDEQVSEITPIRMHAGGVDVDPAGTFNDVKYGDNPCSSEDAGGHFGTAAERSSDHCPAILGARALAYRYLVFGHDHAHSPGSSGIAELPGNDFMVTLGSWNRDDILVTGGERAGAAGAFSRARAKVEAGTIMHEMGHTLNLKHGGSDHNNCKPNFISVMNYSLQFPNLIPRRPLDYSSKALIDLNEAALNENFGFGGKVGEYFLYNTAAAAGMRGDLIYELAFSSNIDWNNDGSITTMTQGDIDFIPAAGCDWQPALQTLKGFDDWANLLFNFRTTADYGDGSQRSVPASFEPENTPDITMDAAMNFDFDEDGLVNALDNCAAIANPDQADVDNDGVGDVCEMGEADLSIAAQNGNLTEDTAAAEQLQFFKLAVYNAGPDSAFAVSLSDTLYADANLSVATAENGSCVVSSAILDCTSDMLAPGDSMIVIYQTVLPVQTQVDRWAAVRAEAIDPELSNNEVSGVVNVATEDQPVPAEIRLYQNFPNPFRQQTRVAFELPASQPVRLIVYDMLGREVYRALDATKPAGRHEVRIPATALASGIYMYRFEVGDYVENRQMVVLR